MTRELTGPPIVGKSYLVPAIHYPFHGKVAWWAVMGPRHEDKELLGFSDDHYHMDWRFASAWAVDRALGQIMRHLHVDIGSGPYGVPLCTRKKPVPLLPLFKPMVCKRVTVPTMLRTLRPFDKVSEFYAGRPVFEGPRGLVCPHRGAELHTLEPNADGVVVCPLHGLHICTVTRRVMPALEKMAGAI